MLENEILDTPWINPSRGSIDVISDQALAQLPAYLKLGARATELSAFRIGLSGVDMEC